MRFPRARVLGLLALGLLAGGCGAWTALSPVQAKAEVCMPVAEAKATLADLKAIYQRVAPVARAKLGSLTPAHRKAVTDADMALQRLYFEAERAVESPGVAVNWARVGQYLAVLIGAAL